MDLTEKTISSDIKFQGKIVTLRVDKALLPNGKEATREVVEHCSGVCVAAVTDENELLFVRQYRYPIGKLLLELPAGKNDLNEDPMACGIRELKEETGATAKEVSLLSSFYVSPGFCDEIIYVYEARGLSFGDSCPDEDEFLEVLRIPLEKAVQMVLDGEFEDAKTIAAILALHAKRTPLN